MNAIELYVVKEYKFDNPLISEIDSIIDKCFRGCHNIYFHNFIYRCIYDIKLKKILYKTNKEKIDLTISDNSMHLYELNKKLTVARERGFRFLHINKLTIRIYSHLRYISISYYLKFRIPMCHRQFIRVISQNPEYVENFCNDSFIPFHFACHKRINQLN